jgi:DNA-binding NtrC family response regulator
MSTSSKMSVFLVDDDAFFLELIKDSISGIEGIEVFSFTNAEDCIAQLDKKPSVIFLDHFLNKENPQAMNGIDALPKIKEILPNTKVIMLTGQDSLDTAEDMMKKGAYFYINKDENAISLIEKKLNLIIATS